MDAQIALVLVHPYTREAIACATRTIHGNHPKWLRDPELQDALWDFATKTAEYAIAQTFMLEHLANVTPGQRARALFAQLPVIHQWIEDTSNHLNATFSDLPGIESGMLTETIVSRIAYFTAIVAQSYRIGMDPRRLLEG